MKKIYTAVLTLSVSLVSVAAVAQAPTWEWADAAGDHGYEAAYAVATDATGNAYIAGSYTSAFIDFGTFSLLNAFSGTADIFVVKYDPSGTVLWANTIGAADGDAATAIKVDASGNVLVTGWFASSSITFGSTVLTNSGSASCDFFIAKYDASGNLLWAKSAGGTSNDRGQDVSADANGNIYVAGWYASPSINFGNGVLSNSGSASNEIFVVKYDPAGNAVWSKSVGGTNYDAAYGCETDANGDLYVTGSFASASIDFGSGALTNTQTGFHDFFINKYDPSGNSLWSRSANGAYDDIAYSVFPCGSNVYVTGYFSSPTIQFGSTPSLSNPGSPTSDIFIAQYSSTGTANWSARAGGTDDDQARSVYADASGNAYITGFFMSGSIGFGTGTLTNNSSGTKDVFVNAFNSSGASMWSLSVGNVGDEIGYGIANTTTADVIYVAGMFNSGFTTFGSTTIYKGCGDDVFLAKLGSTTAVPEDNSGENNFQVSPNPSTGIFTLSGDLNNAKVEIINAIGEVVSSGTDANGNIDLSAYGKGVYLVRISSDGNVYTRRAVVQ